VADLKPRVDKAFQGNGMHVKLHVVTGRGKYVPGKDDPVYQDRPGPRCFGFDAPKFTPAVATAVTSLPNSPAEQEMLGSLLGSTMDEVPAWSSLLVGPLFRGAEVTVE
jgi:phospholipid/cholesterol/gamma-HCH transport system substrate-binding protein